MRCRVPILLCALLLLGASIGATPVAGQSGTDGTSFDVQLHPNGDATWNVSLRIPIADDGEREEFESFAGQFEAGEGDLDLGTDAFERAATEASSASGRDMSIQSVRRDSEVVNETRDGDDVEQYGVLRITFTWESFARIGENDTLYVDDAFNTTDGTWLPGLSADQSLTIRAPPGYGGPTTSPIGAAGGDLYWDGPTTFEPGYFTIVYHPSSTATPATGLSNVLVGGAMVLSGSALLLGVYLMFARRRGGYEPNDDASEVTTSSDSGAEPADSSTAGPIGAIDSDVPEPEDGPATAAPDPPIEDEKPNFDLLSDEERVEYFLEQNGGRMKQATIVKETGWSNAKVSQLLSSMDEANRVDKLRIGRENLISLPGEGIGTLENGEDDGEDA